jgi:hypothetical protein
MDSQFEWTAHEAAALKEGLEPAIIDVVRRRKNVAGLAEKEAFIISYGHEFLGKKKVRSQTFAAGLWIFGRQGIVNLAALMGDYASTALLIRTFDNQLPPGQKPLLPIP